MSRRVLNPNQLRMFMTPREIAATIPQAETQLSKPEDLAINDGYGYGDGNGNRDYKVRAAKQDPKFYDSVVKEGVKKPIDIMHHEYDGPEVVNGHHRFSVALSVAPDRLVPVMHHDNDSTIDWSGRWGDLEGNKPYKASPVW